MIERARSMATAAKYLWPLPNRGLDRRLHRIAAPTLVLWGESDGVVSPAYGKAFRDRLPDATLEIVSGAAHLPHEEQPDKTAELTLQFLEGTGMRHSSDGAVVGASSR
jgi:pimeloyl-ACP methyl ester carboxylesterase